MQTESQTSEVRFRVICSSCNKPMLANPEHNGRQNHCPSCQELVKVPYPVAETAPRILAAINARPVDDSWQWQRIRRPLAIPQPRAW
jgi:hypothetical protein